MSSHLFEVRHCHAFFYSSVIRIVLSMGDVSRSYSCYDLVHASMQSFVCHAGTLRALLAYFGSIWSFRVAFMQSFADLPTFFDVPCSHIAFDGQSIIAKDVIVLYVL